jgi:aquaporin Z
MASPASRPLLSEVLGTFALVFAGCGAVVIDGVAGGVIGHLGVSITFGLVVMTVIYALGDISGAHINPAVTLGFVAAGRFPAKRALPYIVAQCVGALAACGVLRLMFPDQGGFLGGTKPAGPILQSFILEVVITFLLMLVILRVAFGAKETGLLAGVAIGAMVGLLALFAGPISGASMNPARSIGPAVVSGQVGELWIYLTAPVIGALLAVPACWYLGGEGWCADTRAGMKASR